MPELKEFVKGEICSFIKEQRVRAKIPPTVRLNGYVLGELEKKAEQIPLCDLYPIIKYLDDGSFGQWWFNFQIQVDDLKKARASL